jgi:hypothetical protein
MKHKREINSHPLDRNVHIRLTKHDGSTEELVLKSRLYSHLKLVFQHAYAGKNGKVEIHAEDGRLWHKSLAEIRQNYKRVIQIL